MEKRAGVYSIRCLINNKIYIGSSVHVGVRLAEHRNLLRRNKHTNISLQNDFTSYGEENFTFEPIEFCSRADIVQKEDYYIDLYQARTAEFGYNQRAAQNQAAINNEVRQKISDRLQGRKLSTQARQNIRSGHLGVRPTLEARRRMSEAAKLVYQTPEGRKMQAERFLGRKHTDATRALIQQKAIQRCLLKKQHFVEQFKEWKYAIVLSVTASEVRLLDDSTTFTLERNSIPAAAALLYSVMPIYLSFNRRIFAKGFASFEKINTGSNLWHIAKVHKMNYSFSDFTRIIPTPRKETSLTSLPHGWVYVLNKFDLPR